MIRKSPLPFLLVLVTIAAIPSLARAQTDRRPAFALFRWLGNGYSDGYHVRNPGHDSSYYNPYSQHNSNRVVLPSGETWIHPIQSEGRRQSIRRPELQSSWTKRMPAPTSPRVSAARSVLESPVLEGPAGQSATLQPSVHRNDLQRPRRWQRPRRR